MSDLDDMITRYTGIGEEPDENSPQEILLRYSTAIVPKSKAGQVALGGAGGLYVLLYPAKIFLLSSSIMNVCFLLILNGF